MITVLLSLFLSVSHASQVRDLPLRPQDVGVVLTSVKFSTVIQVSEKPLNVVIGDQNNFRVEFIGNNITVKPLRSGAKTNLFIFTENDRFNLTIQSGKSTEVNYVVKLHRIYEEPQKPVDLNYHASSGPLKITLLRKVKGQSSTFFDFKLENSSKKSVELMPDQFRMVVSGRVQPISDLFLEKTTLTSNQPCLGSLRVDLSNLNRSFSIWVGQKQGRPLVFSFNGTREKAVNHAAAF